jgi:hypothetical protein
MIKPTPRLFTPRTGSPDTYVKVSFSHSLSPQVPCAQQQPGLNPPRSKLVDKIKTCVPRKLIHFNYWNGLCHMSKIQLFYQLYLKGSAPYIINGYRLMVTKIQKNMAQAYELNSKSYL